MNWWFLFVFFIISLVSHPQCCRVYPSHLIWPPRPQPRPRMHCVWSCIGSCGYAACVGNCQKRIWFFDGDERYPDRGLRAKFCDPLNQRTKTMRFGELNDLVKRKKTHTQYYKKRHQGPISQNLSQRTTT